MRLFRRVRPETRDRVAQLEEALARLPAVQRQAYRLVAIDRLTVAEAAERMQVAPQAVEDRLVDTLVSLAALINAESAQDADLVGVERRSG